MERKKASDFDQELLDLFDHYVHGRINRRGFLDGAGKFAVGGLTAAALLDMLKPNFAWAQQVATEDPRIRTERATVPSPQGNGSIDGYLVRPSGGTGKYPAVLVIHENRGLNPYVEDVARRLGAANFMAFAPDALTTLGGYPGDEDQGRALFGKIDREKLGQDFLASANWLKGRPDCTGRLGAVGFCFGGGVVNSLAVQMPDLGAAVPFYGSPPAAADVAQIKAAVLVHHGALDAPFGGVMAGVRSCVESERCSVPGVRVSERQPRLHNDTTPRYDEAAATLAWQRTLELFNKTLG